MLTNRERAALDRSVKRCMPRGRMRSVVNDPDPLGFLELMGKWVTLIREEYYRVLVKEFPTEGHQI